MSLLFQQRVYRCFFTDTTKSSFSANSQQRYYEVIMFCIIFLHIPWHYHFCEDPYIHHKIIMLWLIFLQTPRRHHVQRWHRRDIMILSCHYSDVIMGAIASKITSLMIVYSSVYSDADQRKYIGQCGQFTGTGKLPAQMASNAENVSIWWRHHVLCNVRSSTVVSSFSV